jgi:TonB family protein
MLSPSHSARRIRFTVILALAVFLAPHYPLAAQSKVNVPRVTLDQLMLAAPKPEYPVGARARHITGHGVFDVWFRSETGVVTHVDVLQSTGSKLLDDAAVKGLSGWRAKPGKLSHMHIPVNFTM